MIEIYQASTLINIILIAGHHHQQFGITMMRVEARYILVVVVVVVGLSNFNEQLNKRHLYKNVRNEILADSI